MNNDSYIVTSSGIVTLKDKYDGAHLEHAAYVPKEVQEAIRKGALVVLWDGTAATPLENNSEHTKAILKKAEEAIVPTSVNGISVRVNGRAPEGFISKDEANEMVVVTALVAGLAGLVLGALLASGSDGGTHYHVTVPPADAA